jgi:integration host factor subunit beta
MKCLADSATEQPGTGRKQCRLDDVFHHGFGSMTADGIAIVCGSKGEDSMNKSELIEALAEKTNLPIREASSITNTLIDTMSDALAKGDSIEIRGFGSFVVKEYDSYIGRNPKTGEKIKVAPKKLPFFKVGKDLREKVNQQRKKKSAR